MELREWRPQMFSVYDDVLPDPHAYRAFALTQPFGSVAAGSDVFHGIARTDGPTLRRVLETIMPNDAVAAAHAWLSMFRLSPYGQAEPNFVHSDAGMGTWTAILYLNERPPAGDGTSFWRHKVSRVDAGPWDESMRDPDLWERWHHVDAEFNRLLVFRSDLYHSRGIPENYGEGTDARLIQVVFGRGATL